MDWIELLDLPKGCKVNLPITKVSLKQRDQITLNERSLLDGADIQSIRLFGVVKKSNANIESIEDDKESYLEIFFIVVQLTNEAYQKTYKPISRLLHKLIPHHCIINTQSDNKENQHISLYTKLINQQRKDMRVLNKEVITPNILPQIHAEFLKHLSFSSAQRNNLREFYHYYLQVVQTYLLAEVTQEFKLRPYADTQNLMLLYDQYYEYEEAINAKTKELRAVTQMSERVAINTEIHTLNQNLKQIKDKLYR